MPKTIELDGAEVEVYTAEEVQASKEAAAQEARTAADAEWTPKLTEATTKLTDTEKRLQERTGEFNNFRKLNEDQVAKLSEAERTIYENGLALQKANDDRVAAETRNQKDAIANVIRSKAGTNAELQKKMEEMWPIIGIEATTSEQLEYKALAVMGAISTTSPNLIAGVAGFTGSYAPPGAGDEEKKGFGETERGQAIADALGLKTKPDEKK